MNEFIYILRHVLIYQNTPDAMYAQSSSNFQTSKDQGDCQEASGTHALATLLIPQSFVWKEHRQFLCGWFCQFTPYMLFCKRAFHNPCHCDDSFVGLRIESRFIAEEI